VSTIDEIHLFVDCFHVFISYASTNYEILPHSDVLVFAPYYNEVQQTLANVGPRMY